MKHLKDFSEEMENAGNKLKVLDSQVVLLLTELLDCVKKGFITWIRSIIKGIVMPTLFFFNIRTICCHC